LPEAKDWVVNAGDIAGEALWHVVQEADTGAKDQVVSALDSAREALQHVVQEMRTLDTREKALDCALDSARKALWH
jgi:hypothetical protein